MGAVCCVAAKDRTIQHGSTSEILHRNFRHSPSWSFRWDNRVGAAGEESSVGGLSDVASRSDLQDLKSVTDVSAHVSDGGSSLESYRTGGWRKSPMNQESNENPTTSGSGHSIARNSSVKGKQSADCPEVLDPACIKPSPSIHSSPSLSSSSLSAPAHQHPPASPSPNWVTTSSPGHQLPHQSLDNQSSERNSSSVNSITEDVNTPYSSLPSTSNSDSTRSPYGRPSFGSDSYRFSCDNLSRPSCQKSRSISIDFQACAICSKLVSDQSAWSSQKIIAGNELAVVAVLVCGHVYHAECLEIVTPDINKYDPACPICTFGEKQTMKLSGKMLKAERDLKAQWSKKSRNQVVDPDGGSFDFDHWKSNSHEGFTPKLSSSSSLKIPAAKPFPRRHFSFGSRSSKSSSSEGSSARKRGLFWTKSTRE